MRASPVGFISAVVLSIASTVAAQSAIVPLPAVMVVDGDGTVVGEVVDLFCTDQGECYPVIVISVDGTPAFLHVRDYGLVNLAASAGYLTPTLYFSATGCAGDAALPQYSGVEDLIGARFGVAGPDPTLGTYALYRSTAASPAPFDFQSYWVGGECTDASGTILLYAADAVIPNPLEGFHGPTVAQPDRTWSVVGGTRYVPPAP